METSKVAERMLTQLRAQVDVSRLDATSLSDTIETMVRQDAALADQGLNERASLMNQIYAAIRGYDILDEWLHDPEVTEIMCNRYDQIYIERNGRLERTHQRFASEEKYHDIIQKIVNDAGKEVHLRQPIVDCRMPDGSRVNVVLNPVSGDGAALTIRRFRSHIYTLDELVENGTLSFDAASFLKRCVRAKLNIFISGGTGSGKTTLLNALANEIPRDERLITVEDARELNFENIDNWVALEARRPNASGEGAISIRDLIRASLRMRPDRIIVGEVRGPEAIDAIQAMNTGHDGSFCTGHANSIPDMQLRLETMILSGHDGLPIDAVRQQIAAAIDLFVHVSRLRDHRRYVVAIAEPLWEDGAIHYHEIYKRTVDDQKIGPLVGDPLSLARQGKFLRAGISLSDETMPRDAESESTRRPNVFRLSSDERKARAMQGGAVG
ncbi:MAG: CpaF family protein [Peptoniphilaceae bacterium]|nr:CpaF family protein [Peptoniphilaceae bacterium]MDY6085860.1 CpaF family protein [Peptoniphilaceae bacterium]